jgi:hypothetical protein
MGSMTDTRCRPGRTRPRRDRVAGAAAAARVLLGLVAFFLAIPTVGFAQTAGPIRLPDGIGGTPVVNWEHGSEAAALFPAASVLGLVITDIATAPGSVGRYNLSHPDDLKSPGTAFRMSLVSTAAPVVLGAIIIPVSPEVGGALIFTGVVVGPSVGHWYAGRTGRGLLTAGLRLGLTILTGMAALAAS